MRRCQRVRARPGENKGEKESCLYGPDPAPAVGGDLREELGRRYVEEYGDILKDMTGDRDWLRDNLSEWYLRPLCSLIQVSSKSII